MLHEGLGSVGLWRDFPARLARATGCGVFAYSRLGYGRSDAVKLPRPLDYMQREATEILPRVLDAGGIGPCVLVGHSDGASIAAVYAGRANDARLRGLALMAPHFFVEDVSLQAIAAIRHDYRSGTLRARLARRHDHPDCAFLGWADSWLDPDFPAAFNLSADLGRITLPMVILQGDADPYGTIAHAQLAERLCQGTVRTVLLHCGHAPHIEAPDQTIAAVTQLAREALGARGS